MISQIPMNDGSATTTSPSRKKGRQIRRSTPPRHATPPLSQVTLPPVATPPPMAAAAPNDADAVAAACRAAGGEAPSLLPLPPSARVVPSAGFAPGGDWTSRGGELRRRFSAALLLRFSLEGVAVDGAAATGGGVGGRASMMHGMSLRSRSTTRPTRSPLGELRCSPPSPPPVGRVGVAGAVLLMVPRSSSSQSAWRAPATVASRGSEAGATPAIAQASERASDRNHSEASNRRATRWHVA